MYVRIFVVIVKRLFVFDFYVDRNFEFIIKLLNRNISGGLKEWILWKYELIGFDLILFEYFCLVIIILIVCVCFVILLYKKVWFYFVLKYMCMIYLWV